MYVEESKTHENSFNVYLNFTKDEKVDCNGRSSTVRHTSS